MNDIQLIGAYTKIGHEAAKQIFNAVQEYLEKKGWHVHNPTTMVPEGTAWGEAMNITLDNIRKMDAVYLVQNWTISEGSRLEVQEAMLWGLHMYHKNFPPPDVIGKKYSEVVENGHTRLERMQAIRKKTEVAAKTLGI